MRWSVIERNTASPRCESWPCSSSSGHHRVAAGVRGERDEPGAQAGVVDGEPQPVLDAARAGRRRRVGLDEQEAGDAEPLEVVDPVGLLGPVQDHDVLGGTGSGDDFSSGSSQAQCR